MTLDRRFEIMGPPPPEGSDVWWRLEDRRYATPSQSNLVYQHGPPSTLRIMLVPFVMVRSTPKGVWVQDWLGHEYFVLGTAARQRAVPTVELAIRDLIARRSKEARMHETRARYAWQAVEHAERMLKGLPEEETLS